jgi:hypothetical protein
MTKSLVGMFVEVLAMCDDLNNEAMLPVWFERDANGGAVAHFNRSRVCTIQPKTGSSPTFGTAQLEALLTMRYAAAELVYENSYCTTCFCGAGLRDIKVWASSSDAPEALSVFFVRYEILKLWEGCAHVRTGLVGEFAYGAREAPATMRHVAKMRMRILSMDTEELLVHKTAISLFESAARELEALVEPGDGAWALGRLRQQLIGRRGAWVVLDEAPTILAIEGGINWRIRKTTLGPELVAGLIVSDPSNGSVVVYGPRFAIDYLQRAYGDNFAYVMATAEPDEAVARLAAGLWDTDDGISDLFSALETARSLMSGGS